MAETPEQAKPFVVKAREFAKRFLRHENTALIVVLAALIGVMSLATKGLSASPANARNILIQSSIRGVAAVGQAFVILTAGIDLSVGGMGLFCTYLGGLLMTEGPARIVAQPFPIYQAIPIMMITGLGLGVINGLGVSRVGLPPLIATLALWEITKGASFHISGGQSVFELPPNLGFFGQGAVAGVPVPVIIFITVAVVAYLVLQYTTFGRSVYAVGGNPASSWLTGINVKRVLLLAYAISGFLVGLASVIYIGRVMAASYQSLRGLELDCIAATVIGGVSLAGGRGTIVGAVIGAIIIGVINNGMSILGAGPALQGTVKGAVIYAAVTIDFLRRR